MRKDIEARTTVETKANVLEEMRLIQLHLESDEGDSLRFRISRPLTRVSQNSSNTVGSPFEGINVSHTSWRERALTRSKTQSSTTFSLHSVRKGSSYHSAGLFEDCKHAFFNNDREISVYQLGDLRRKPALQNFSRVFTQQYRCGECIRSVAASTQAFIIIVTNKRLLIFNLDTDVPIVNTSHGDWDPSGLACHESETHLVVFIGQCQRNNTDKYNGQIKIYRYRIDDQLIQLPVFAFNVPANDCPKRVSFDSDSQILTCITRIQNKLLVWKLNDEFLSSLEPFRFLKNKYAAVSAQIPAAQADRR